jgi:putative ABC transport system ATP-binding protein
MIRIDVQQVCRYFRGAADGEVRALDDVTLTIESASFQTLVGPSGSGKSTLLAILGALDHPTSGKVVFDGRDLSGCSHVALARVRRRVGFVFQNFSLVRGLPNWENVTYPLIPRGVRRAERFEIARRLMDRLGMADKLARRPEELSGGEQQRVAVARALAADPGVILADEPTSNLDSRTAGELLALFRELHAAGKTIVVATHDPTITQLATDVVELGAGRLVRRNGTEEH